MVKKGEKLELSPQIIYRSTRGYIEMQSTVSYRRGFEALRHFLHECLWAVTKLDGMSI